MVNEDYAKAALVGKRLQRAQIAIIGGVRIAVSSGVAYRLQRVDDDQAELGMQLQLLIELDYQAIFDFVRHHREMQAVARLVGQVEEALLDARKGVFQAEVKNLALLGRMV